MALLAGGMGCGRSSPADQVRAAYREYLSTAAHGDFRRFCGLLSDANRGRLGAAKAVASCATALRSAASSDPSASAKLKSDVTGQRVVAVHITGRRAQITVAKRLGGLLAKGQASAVLEHGSWKIDEALTHIHVGRETVYQMPSESMLPGLPTGARVLADPASYRNQSPAIGDIVIFHPPKNDYPGGCANAREGHENRAPCGVAQKQRSSEIFTKRVVAGPGDKIKIIDGHAIVNGEREKDGYIRPCSFGSGCDFPKTITVPNGEYFMLGDNRGYSLDSRFWGPVPKSWITGKVVRRLS
jgi:signal peptidase I